MPAVSIESPSLWQIDFDVKKLDGSILRPPLPTTGAFANEIPQSSPVDVRRRWTQIGNIWTVSQKVTLQELCVALAVVSVVLTIVTAYWFCRMRKRFRHNLIMLLILGDVARTISMLVMTSISLARGQMTSNSGICQAGGAFFQFGTVMNDWSALTLAIHGTVQIMRPSIASAHRADAMFRYRYLIYVALAVIPTLCATLNFVAPSGYYTASGAFCQLPIRPLWYRLALAWIPRYIIALTILGLAIAVYVHVRSVYSGSERRKWWALSSIAIPKDRVDARLNYQSYATPWEMPDTRTFSMFSEDNIDTGSTRPSQSRRFSTFSAFLSGDQSHSSAEAARANGVNVPPQPNARRAPGDVIVEEPIDEKSALDTTTQDHARPDTLIRASSTISRKSGRGSSFRERLSVGERVPAAFKRKRAMSDVSPLHVQRAIIRRQLRLTFIYPLVYLLMWMAPFVLHCMQYNTFYAKQPPFPLGILANVCYTLMAAVDCAIFCYRERPWRHIPANKTRRFWTSFVCWSNGGDTGCKLTGDENGYGRWGSNGEKDQSRRRSGRRKTRGESFDSAMSDEPESLAGPAARSSGDRPPAPRMVRLATDSSQTDQFDVQPIERPGWQRAASNAVAIPAAVTTHGSRSVRGFFHKAQRSDGQKVAQEGARIRLAHELQDRRALEEQRLGGGAAEPAAERHWWDSMRKDSLPGEWEGRRKSLFSFVKSGGSSEKSSPAQSPGERTAPMTFPEVTLVAASPPPQQVREGLHGIQEEADGAASLHSTESEQ